MVNVGKYTGPMDAMGMLLGLDSKIYTILFQVTLS